MKGRVHEGIQSALDWACRTPSFDSLDPKSYRVGYQALLRLFSDHVRPDDYLSVVAGANAVYGWMPTILTGVDETLWQSCRSALLDLADAATWTEAEAIFDETPEVCQLINGSVVGTSKFLHFLNPNVLPIWDSRIASVFGISGHYATAKVANYRNYGRSMAKAVEADLALPDRYVEFVGSDVGPVRRLELLLFLFGREGRPADAKEQTPSASNDDVLFGEWDLSVPGGRDGAIRNLVSSGELSEEVLAERARQFWAWLPEPKEERAAAIARRAGLSSSGEFVVRDILTLAHWEHRQFLAGIKQLWGDYYAAESHELGVLIDNREQMASHLAARRAEARLTECHLPNDFDGRSEPWMDLATGV